VTPHSETKKKKKRFFNKLRRKRAQRRRSNADFNSRSNRWSVGDDKVQNHIPIQIQSADNLEVGLKSSPHSSDKSDSDEEEEVVEEIPHIIQPLSTFGVLEVTVYQIDFLPPPLPTRRKKRGSYLLRCSVGVENKSEPINLHPFKGPQFPIKVVFDISDITGEMKLRIWAKARRHDRCLGQVVVPLGFLNDMGGRSEKLWYQILPTPRSDRDGCYEASHPEVHGSGLERVNEKLGWVNLSLILKHKHGLYLPYLLSPVFQLPEVPRDNRFLPSRFAKNMDRIKRHYVSSQVTKIFGKVVSWQSPGLSIGTFFVWSWFSLKLKLHWYPLFAFAWMATTGYFVEMEDPPLDVWETQTASAEIGSLGYLAEVYKVAPQLQEVDEWIEYVATTMERFRFLFDWNTDERMSIIICVLGLQVSLILSGLIFMFDRYNISYRVLLWFGGVIALCPLRKGHVVNRWLWQLVESTILRYVYFMIFNITKRCMDIKKYEHFKILEKTRTKKAPPQLKSDPKKERTVAKYHKSSAS